jgi:hypothetical protein
VGAMTPQRLVVHVTNNFGGDLSPVFGKKMFQKSLCNHLFQFSKNPEASAATAAASTAARAGRAVVDKSRPRFTASVLRKSPRKLPAHPRHQGPILQNSDPILQNSNPILQNSDPILQNPIRPKTFRINFPPQNLDKFPLKKHKFNIGFIM